MKLDTVLTACNTNSKYIDFIPIFIKAWKTLLPDIKIKIIIISSNIPKEFLKYRKYIICFKPIEGISTSFTSQYIRILYPALIESKGGILITDIDMLPMNKKYYVNNIENIESDKFIYYREYGLNNSVEIAICYSIAIQKTWQNIFKIKNIEDIVKHLIDVNSKINYVEGHGKSGWNTDQKNLYKYVMKWNNLTNKFVFLKDSNTNFRRLDRHRFVLDNYTKARIKNGYYSDYHCFTPYKQYSKINNKIVDLIRENPSGYLVTNSRILISRIKDRLSRLIHKIK